MNDFTHRMIGFTCFIPVQYSVNVKFEYGRLQYLLVNAFYFSAIGVQWFVLPTLFGALHLPADSIPPDAFLYASLIGNFIVKAAFAFHRFSHYKVEQLKTPGNIFLSDCGLFFERENCKKPVADTAANSCKLLLPLAIYCSIMLSGNSLCQSCAVVGKGCHLLGATNASLIYSSVKGLNKFRCVNCAWLKTAILNSARKTVNREITFVIMDVANKSANLNDS